MTKGMTKYNQRKISVSVACVPRDSKHQFIKIFFYKYKKQSLYIIINYLINTPLKLNKLLYVYYYKIKYCY